MAHLPNTEPGTHPGNIYRLSPLFSPNFFLQLYIPPVSGICNPLSPNHSMYILNYIDLSFLMFLIKISYFHIMLLFYSLSPILFFDFFTTNNVFYSITHPITRNYTSIFYTYNSYKFSPVCVSDFLILSSKNIRMKLKRNSIPLLIKYDAISMHYISLIEATNLVLSVFYI